jgi:hypothetical protein
MPLSTTQNKFVFLWPRLPPSKLDRARLIAEEREVPGVIALHKPHGVLPQYGKKIVLQRFHFRTNLVESGNAVGLVILLGHLGNIVEIVRKFRRRKKGTGTFS